MPKLKIEINTTNLSRYDLRTFMQEITNHSYRGIELDVRRPVKDFNGREIGHYTLESDIVWPDPMRMDEV